MLALLAAAAITAIAYAVVVAPRRLRLTTIDAPIPGLPAAFDGYTIAVLSDIHHGAVWGSRTHLKRAITLAHAAAPDLIALLGDYGLSHHRLPRASRRAYERAMPVMGPLLRSLHAPDGVVAVIGNHDYDYDASAVAAWLRETGSRVLVNEAVCIERAGARLAISGVDDAASGKIDPHAGCAHLEPHVPRIVLSHNPDGVLSLATDARVDLVLSGHTHGGQVVLPFVGALSRRCKLCGRHTARGWVPNPRAPLYVTSGVGAIIPLRVHCPPEVLVVRLRPRAG
ncbi:MAG: metallophosphoesterase [Gemmatimonadaceae bacterium]|nr:metallophosphoesterase [Gemmatimonadaceae bacterium]